LTVSDFKLDRNLFNEIEESKEEELKEAQELQNCPCVCQDRVLIVDDNSFNLIPLELLLDVNFGIKVDKAENGLMAVRAVAKNL